jgi:DNA polymerase-1
MRIIDVETDGFLEELTQIYCAWGYDTETEEFSCFNNQNNGQGSIEDFIQYCSEGDLLAHFGIGFDYLAMGKLYPDWEPKGKLYDSVLESQLIWPNLKSIDFARLNKPAFRDFPRRLIGSHSLKAWGWRLGDFKDDFNPSFYVNFDAMTVGHESDLYPPYHPYQPLRSSKWRKCDIKAYGPDNAILRHTWKTIGWMQEMEDYCKQDVQVTKVFKALIDSKGYSRTAIEMETSFASIIKRQEMYGWRFDEKKAERLHAKLQIHEATLADELESYFPAWVVETTFVPKVNNKTRGYVKGVPFIKSKTITFKPSSRDHIADRLITVYGWKPTIFNEGDGKPTVDEQTLKDLPFPPIKALLEYLMVSKRLGMLAEGRQAWLKAVKGGRIYGRVNTLGAITGRCTHSNPNVAQVPAGGSPYGPECRELFSVDTGYTLVGADASGLELRCLAHYMAAFDDGVYGDIILNGDIHTENQKAAGLPTRDNAKTFIYGFLYGAGDGKIGEIVNGTSKDGAGLRQSFLEKLPALKQLTDGVKGKAKKTKTLKGLDGRILSVRSQHSALNTLLQSAGALIMKQALIELDILLQDAGLKQSWQSPTPDYEFVGNIHDEFQIQVKDEHVDLVKSLCPSAMTKAGEFFNFRCRIDGEAKSGTDWSHTH